MSDNLNFQHNANPFGVVVFLDLLNGPQPVAVINEILDLDVPVHQLTGICFPAISGRTLVTRSEAPDFRLRANAKPGGGVKVITLPDQVHIQSAMPPVIFLLRSGGVDYDCFGGSAMVELPEIVTMNAGILAGTHCLEDCILAAKRARGMDGRNLLRGSASIGLALFLVASV